MLVQTFGYMISGDDDPAYKRTYKFLYTMFGRHYGINLNLRVANEIQKKGTAARTKMQIAADMGLLDKLYATAYYYLFQLPIMDMTDDAFVAYVELVRAHNWVSSAEAITETPISKEESEILVHSVPAPDKLAALEDDDNVFEELHAACGVV